MLTEVVKTRHFPSVQGRALENGFVWTGDRKDSLYTACHRLVLSRRNWLALDRYSTYHMSTALVKMTKPVRGFISKKGTPPQYYDFGTRVWFEITE